jgi:hypothetical protein
MGAGDFQVVVLDRDPGEDRVDEGLAAGPAGRTGQLHPHEQLGGGDGGDGYVIVVPDQLVQGQEPALACDDDGRVEDQPFQACSSIGRSARNAEISAGQSASGR